MIFSRIISRRIVIFSRVYVFNFSRVFRAWNSLKEMTPTLVFFELHPMLFICKKHFNNSAVRLKKDSKISSTFSKYELFSEETAPVILDVEEERQKTSYDEKVFDEFEGINLNWGITGVFDIEEIVHFLQREKGEDIFVAKIPPEFNYADYIVIVTGRSTKHMLAMSSIIRNIYKRKTEKCGLIPHLEGKNSNVWMALDLGNIILHVFSKEGRKAYDLETLWSVGKEYDTLSLKTGAVSEDLITDYKKILAHLSPKN